MTTQSAQPATLVNGGTLTSVNGPGPVSGMVAKSILAPRGSEESARRTSGGGPPVQAPFKGKVDLEAEAVKRYRQRRCQLLLDWWQSYVEEVSGGGRGLAGRMLTRAGRSAAGDNSVHRWFLRCPVPQEAVRADCTRLSRWVYPHRIVSYGPR
jgi:hypothetical protein